MSTRSPIKTPPVWWHKLDTIGPSETGPNPTYHSVEQIVMNTGKFGNGMSFFRQIPRDPGAIYVTIGQKSKWSYSFFTKREQRFSGEETVRGVCYFDHIYGHLLLYASLSLPDIYLEIRDPSNGQIQKHIKFSVDQTSALFNNWVHWVILYDNTNQNEPVSLYVDGRKLQATEILTNNPYEGPFRFGTDGMYWVAGDTNLGGDYLVYDNMMVFDYLLDGQHIRWLSENESWGTAAEPKTQITGIQIKPKVAGQGLVWGGDRWDELDLNVDGTSFRIQDDTLTLADGGVRAEHISDSALGNGIFRGADNKLATYPQITMDRAPSQNDDSSGSGGAPKAYPGVIWLDTSDNAIYVCQSAEANNAVWTRIWRSWSCVYTPYSMRIPPTDQAEIKKIQLPNGDEWEVASFDDTNMEYVVFEGFIPPSADTNIRMTIKGVAADNAANGRIRWNVSFRKYAASSWTTVVSDSRALPTYDSGGAVDVWTGNVDLGSAGISPGDVFYLMINISDPDPMYNRIIGDSYLLSFEIEGNR